MGKEAVWSTEEGLPRLIALGDGVDTFPYDSEPGLDQQYDTWLEWQDRQWDVVRVAHLSGGATLQLAEVELGRAVA
jgi:hypothetical protein